MENGNRAIYLDGPAGTQVPQSVVDRISQCMLNHNANRSGSFATSREVDFLMSQSHDVFADFLGATSSDSIVFTQHDFVDVPILASLVERMEGR